MESKINNVSRETNKGEIKMRLIISMNNGDYFEDIEEVTDFLLDNNVTLIKKK